jgi:hypothetical protein
LNKKFIAVLAIAALLLYLWSSGLSRLGLVTPGWEIYNQVAALRHNDVIYTTEDQFTSPKELMGVYWKVDLDDPQYGVPTIMVQVGDIHHVDFSGRDIPNDQYAKTITVTRGNDTYYLDYHIYLYTVTIRTIADKVQYAGGGAFFVPKFMHETSFPYEGWNGIFGGVGSTYVGKKFAGGVYTKFVISPWRGVTYRTAPENYVLKNCWAGVMNTYVLKKDMGQVANQWGELPDPDPLAPMFVKGGLDEGNQVPMFEDDGTFGTPSPTVNWDPSLTPDVRIASTVVHYLPVELLAGAKLHTDWTGVMDDMYPCDVYIQYTLRVDVLQVHDFTLETAYKPPTPTPPTDFWSWAKSFWEGVFSGISSWFTNPLNQLWLFFVIIVAVILVVTALNPGIWIALASLFKRGGGE